MPNKENIALASSAWGGWGWLYDLGKRDYERIGHQQLVEIAKALSTRRVVIRRRYTMGVVKVPTMPDGKNAGELPRRRRHCPLRSSRRHRKRDGYPFHLYDHRWAGAGRRGWLLRRPSHARARRPQATGLPIGLPGLGHYQHFAGFPQTPAAPPAQRTYPAEKAVLGIGSRAPRGGIDIGAEQAIYRLGRVGRKRRGGAVYVE